MMASLKTARGIYRYLDGVISGQQDRDDHRLRDVMKALPRRMPSSELRIRLEVLASRERARQLARLTFSQQWSAWKERTSLVMNNLMKPLMVPVAGGLAAACILFGMLVPDFTVETHPVHNDVPTGLFTEATVKETIPVSISDHDVVIDLHVDEQGRMTDYHVIAGQNLLQNETVRRRLESTLLLTQFTPASYFGVPTTGKIRISFRTKRIDMRG
jgi:hypothetical protein